MKGQGRSSVCVSMIVLGSVLQKSWFREGGHDVVALGDTVHMSSGTGQIPQAGSQMEISRESEKEVAVSCWSASEGCQNKATPRCLLSSKLNQTHRTLWSPPPLKLRAQMEEVTFSCRPNKRPTDPGEALQKHTVLLLQIGKYNYIIIKVWESKVGMRCPGVGGWPGRDRPGMQAGLHPTLKVTWHTTASRPAVMECASGFCPLWPASLQMTLQPHTHGWNSSLSLTWGWYKVILSLLKWYKPNMREPTSSSLWYFGMVYLSQEKTITYYPEGYSFLLFVVGVGVGGVTRGRKMVKQRLGAWMFALSIFP